MSGFSRLLMCAALGVGLLALPAANASAAMVYRSSGGWHTHEKHRYSVKPVMVFYANDWRWAVDLWRSLRPA